MVIGAGVAGLQAALYSAKEGAGTCVFCKGIPANTSTSYIAGGTAVVLRDSNPHDSPDIHFSDTIAAGAFLNDQKRVRILVEEAPEKFAELLHQGARFDKTPYGGLVQKPRGGHSFNRFYTRRGDAGGQEISSVLLKAVKKRDIGIFTDFLILRLLVHDGKAVGAIGFDLKTGDLRVVRAGATVLAAGGAGRVYPVSSMPAEMSGDGYSLAYQAGATLVDMEMVQFHPGGFYSPGILKGSSTREPAYFASLGARLTNSRGERFMERYDSRAERATRDVVARAEYLEAKEGRGSPNGGVYLDLSGLSRRDREELPTMSKRFFDTCMTAGIDPREVDLIEIGPTVHYFMGGVKADENGTTTIPGLYACGEVVGGIHGANRLSGNAISGALVFGARAGSHAAQFARNSPGEVSQGLQGLIQDYLRRDGPEAPAKGGSVSERPVEIEAHLQKIMWEGVGVVRNGKDLKRALSDIHSLREKTLPFEPELFRCRHKRYNRELVSSFELSRLLDNGEMIVHGAMAREESRGAHYRSDFSARDDANWLVHVAIAKIDNELEVWTEPVELKELGPKGVS